MLVSVIIPYFKKKEFIDRTIKSVIRQTIKNIEIIIINDEITESSKKLLKKYSRLDKRIRVINNTKNLGAGYSRNKGIKLSKGKYLAFLDSDDIWRKNKLKDQVKFMDKFNYNISHTSYEIIDEMEKKIALRRSSNLDFKKLKNSCDIGLSTVMIKKNFLIKKKLFPKLITKEDYYFWLYLTKNGEVIYFLNKNLSKWRKTKHSLSSSTIQKLSDSITVYQKYENNLIISVLRSIILSLNFLKKRVNDFTNN